MANTVSAAFTEFLGRITPTDTQVATMRARRQATHGYLAESFGASSDLPLRRTVLIGSAERGTIIRPVQDIDVLAVFDNKNHIFERYRGDSRQFLYRVRDALARFRVKVVGARGQAVRLFYAADPYVDIAPVFSLSGGGYLLPAGDGSWIETDPEFHQRWWQDQSRAIGAIMTPLAQMSKAWNRTHGRHLKSFHLDILVVSAFRSMGRDYAETAAALFGFYSTHHARLHVADPAGKSKDLSEYMTRLGRQEAENAFDSAADRARRALKQAVAGHPDEAIRLWGIIFGSEFPAYG